MIEEQTATENKQLQTNLAQEVLEQFMNLKARISIGIIYLDLQRALGDTKIAIDKFERSHDSNICPYLTELIKKIMSYYELTFQFINSTFLPDKVISTYFPDPPRSIIHGGYSYDIRMLRQSWLDNAGQLTEELHEILNKPVDLSTLNDIDKITALPKPSGNSTQNYTIKKYVTVLQAIFLGVFGIHKFALGYVKEGAIMLAITLFTFGYGSRVMMIVGVIEGLIYISKSTQNFTRTYITKKRGWF